MCQPAKIDIAGFEYKVMQKLGGLKEIVWQITAFQRYQKATGTVVLQAPYKRQNQDGTEAFICF